LLEVEEVAEGRVTKRYPSRQWTVHPIGCHRHHEEAC